MQTKFSERLKNLRLDKGLSQEKLGEALSVSRATVSDWENRAHQPNYNILLDIAIFFNVTTDYLLGLVDEI